MTSLDEIILIEASVIVVIIEVNFAAVSKDTTNASEALDELGAFGRFISDNFEMGDIFFVGVKEPLSEGKVFEDLILNASDLVLPLGAMGGFVLRDDFSDYIFLVVLEGKAVVLEVLPDDEDFDGAVLHGLQRVLEAEDVLAGVLGDFLEEAADNLLLVDELDGAQRVGGEFNGLVEAVLAAVADIHDLEHGGLQSGVEQVGLLQVVLEFGRTSQDKSLDIRAVIGDETGSGRLRDFTHVVVSSFRSDTSETIR